MRNGLCSTRDKGSQVCLRLTYLDSLWLQYNMLLADCDPRVCDSRLTLLRYDSDAPGPLATAPAVASVLVADGGRICYSLWPLT